jgi:4-amino-4-deoxy-L-arabinose transferase-like glycosyltransferase
LLYLAGAQLPLRQRLGHLPAAGAVLAAVSLSWTAVYELTPPRSRPFVDSTRTNSMLELVVGHNGIQRFVSRARSLPGHPACRHRRFRRVFGRRPGSGSRVRRRIAGQP